MGEENFPEHGVGVYNKIFVEVTALLELARKCQDHYYGRPSRPPPAPSLPTNALELYGGKS